MSLVVLDSTTLANVRAATDQEAQLAALIAPWAGVDVTCRVYVGSTHAATLTQGAWTINTGVTPRTISLGARSARTHITTGTPTSVVFRAGSTDIFSVTAGVGSGDVSFWAALTSAASERLAVTVAANAGLPVSAAPAWLAGAAVNEWISISGTSGAGSSLANAYSGWAITSSGVVVIAAAGGHGTGSYDNRVVSLDLMVDSPSWTQRIAATSVAHDTNAANAYETDGKRKASHTYHSTFYSSAIGRVLVTGIRFDLEQNTFNVVDGIDPTAGTWAWDAAGTYNNVSPSGAYPSAMDGAGALWWFDHGTGAVAKYVPATNTWSSPTITGAVTPGVRYPWAWDSTRSQLFGLAWGDGEGFGTDMRAVRQNGTTQAAITFDAGSASAVAQFASDAPTYAGMVYDEANDRFLFFSNDHPTRIYVITPNGTTTWSMSLLTLGAGSATLPAGGYPIVSKFTYVAALNGVVAMPDAGSNLYFLRTT